MERKSNGLQEPEDEISLYCIIESGHLPYPADTHTTMIYNSNTRLWVYEFIHQLAEGKIKSVR